MRQRHKFPASEILINFLHELEHLTKQFSKEMQVNYNHEDISDSFDSQKIFEIVLTKTLKTIIVDKKNLYQSMLFKDKLLSI